ncbi:hypothetical protein [Shewanella sp. YLB-07]|uniref:hypothetical protein n=1 Tax=Shewanella sp. YLB-07 TaxID=2601268 RepID=UPI00128DB667|nr:hypothetical protein [Shewanella sp. YLB-07]MPY24445.1 hypothetical protein [Shewanella sp. YLB-07]
MKIFLSIFLLTSFSFNSHAVNAWYWGEVSNISAYSSDGSFEVEMSNENIANFCIGNSVRFRVSDMGVERTKIAMSMVLTAFALGKDWGVVIDLPSTTETCYASSTASQGAGIR